MSSGLQPLKPNSMLIVKYGRNPVPRKVLLYLTINGSGAQRAATVKLTKMFQRSGNSGDPLGELLLEDLGRTWFSDTLKMKACRLGLMDDLDPTISKWFADGINPWVFSLDGGSVDSIKRWLQQLEHICARVATASNQRVEDVVSYSHFESMDSAPEQLSTLINGGAAGIINERFKRAYPEEVTSLLMTLIKLFVPKYLIQPHILFFMR